MKYLDFVDLTYRPTEDDLICDFYIEPKGVRLEVAAGGVAAESSIGTWTDLTTIKPYVKSLQAKVFEISGNNIRVAYPVDLFEPGNMPNVLSSIAGNVFGLDALKKIRLNNVNFPSRLINSFEGPKYGISGVRQLLDIRERPLVGTIIKPKLGLRTEDHAQIAYEAWVGGCDIVKDDENLGSQAFNRFEGRVLKTLESRDRAEDQTGEKKAYMANVTSETNQMIERAQFIREHGGRYAMIDILTCGFASLQTLRSQNLNLVIHAHRAGHAAFTKDLHHGISMRVIAKVSRIVGVDQLHVGTAVGKMSESRKEVSDNCTALKAEMVGFKPVFPVASGGLHPRLVPALAKIFGKDLIIQAGGGIHGHREGTRAGARAMRQAVDSVMQNVPLNEFAEAHEELRIALEMWK